MTATYGEVLARNIRAARSRAGLQQEPLAARMRALGYSAWLRQTVANVEKARRRVTAEEILGLSLALQTTMAALMAPDDDDKTVDLPSGHVMSAAFTQLSAYGFHADSAAVTWESDSPVFPQLGSVQPSWQAAPSPMPAIQRARRTLAWETMSTDQQADVLKRNSRALQSSTLPTDEQIEMTIPMTGEGGES